MRTTFAALLLLLTGVPAFAQSSTADLSARLLHQPLFLRGLEQSNKLRFDAAGKLTSTSAKTSPMLSAVDIDKMDLKPDRLVMSGQRQAIVYVDHQPQRRDLEKFKVEISTPPGGDYSVPLSAIFAVDLAGLAPAADDYWRPFLNASDSHESRTQSSAQVFTDKSILKVGGNVSPPRLLHAPAPHYSPGARHLTAEGDCLLYLHVEKNGSVSHLRLESPLGAGLDEQGLAAVQAYKFAPALKNGDPVVVELIVSINFRVY